MSVKAIEIHPTFPMDEASIRQLRRAAIWQSPRLLGVQVVGMLGKMLQSLQIGPLNAVAERAVTWWEDEEKLLTLHVIRQLIDQSNQHQNAEIRNMIERLTQEGHPQYAISLGKFLLIKQHIEAELHRSGTVTTRKEKIEQLVDSICQEVCHELYRLSTWESQLAEVLTSRDPQQLERMSELTKNAHGRIMHAYATLAQTADQLALLLTPGQATRLPAEENVALDRLLEILREENSLTQVVDERLRKELPTVE